MAPRMKKTKVSRSAVTGRFVKTKYAKKHPKTTVRETIKRPKGTNNTGARKKSR